MEKPTQPFQAKTATQTPSDEPAFSTLFLVIGGFILVGATVIFVLMFYGHL